MMRIPFVLLTCLIVTGCTGSRWARSDPDYAAKYPHHTGNLARMTKQAIDARHVRGKSGGYAAMGFRGDPHALAAEVGGFDYTASWLEMRGGLTGLLYEGNVPVSGGLLGAARVQSPSRLAPYAGFGAYAGISPETSLRNDGIDNDRDGFVDNDGESERDFVAALIPEAGVHLWLTPKWRLTGSANYYVTTAGRDNDFLMFTVGLSRMSDTNEATTQRGRALEADRLDWEVGCVESEDELRSREYSNDQPLSTQPIFEAPLQKLPPVE
ncbi:MAG: hypothetical protein RH917_19140 [Lacipirellulaceae bacterium]